MLKTVVSCSVDKPCDTQVRRPAEDGYVQCKLLPVSVQSVHIYCAEFYIPQPFVVRCEHWTDDVAEFLVDCVAREALHIIEPIRHIVYIERHSFFVGQCAAVAVGKDKLVHIGVEVVAKGIAVDGQWFCVTDLECQLGIRYAEIDKKELNAVAFADIPNAGVVHHWNIYAGVVALCNASAVGTMFRFPHLGNQFIIGSHYNYVIR